MNRKQMSIYVMYAITFLQGMVFYSSISTLYRHSQGLSLIEMGIIESVFSILVFVFEVPWGYVCDRIGYKKTMLVCNGFYFLSKVIFFKANCFWMFLGERILLAFVTSGLSGCDMAYLYVLIEGKESTHVFGIVRAMGTLGLMFSSCLFSLFIQDQYLKAGLWTIYPYFIAFALTFFLEDINNEPIGQTQFSFDFSNCFLTIKPMILFLIGSALLTETTHTIGIFYNQLQYQRAHIPIAYLGIIYCFMTLLCTISSAMVGRIVHYIQERQFILFLYGMTIFACCLLQVTTSPILSIMMIALLQMSETLFYPMMDTVLNQQVKNSRATTLSIYSMIKNATGVLTNIAFGKSAQMSVIHAMSLGTFFCLTGMILYFIWYQFHKS